MALKLPFGLRLADRRLVDVKAVPNGADCGCVCPACQRGLVAKNAGRTKLPHFAHVVECSDGYETAIHEASKQVIRELGFVWLPSSIVADKRKFTFLGHALEKRYDRVIPDVTVWNNPDQQLAVEIFVTHQIGEEKLKRLRTQQLACVEFDLSELPRVITYEDLREMFTNDTVKSKWVFNPKIDLAERKAVLERHRLEVERRLREKKLMAILRAGTRLKEVYATKNHAGYVIYHVPACPWGARAEIGSFANVNLDCAQCRFCFGIAREGRQHFRQRGPARPITVACAGHLPETRDLAGKGDWRRPRSESGFPNSD